MIKKIKVKKVNKQKVDASLFEKDRSLLFEEAFSFLCDIKKNTRLTDKDKMRFTSEMSESVFDALSNFIKKNTKEK